ncbi:DUF2971 domain-containing protein [Tateyamaria armeniaca]|uniref:DUF2971 domain-containing protein n=1 Tax=Tateyamaria armeniaca TaxID=2518930 RepID=A0ABW8UXT4_9RHOB
MSEKPGFQRVYKFYSSHSALRNISSQRLKVSTLDDLNDPFEFLGFQLPKPEPRNSWIAAKTVLQKRIGLISFCKSWSNPLVWGHYAENHRGLALGFDVWSSMLRPVKYYKHRRKLPNLSLTDPDLTYQAVVSALYAKYIHWQYEEEYRIALRLPDTIQENEMYFQPFEDWLKLSEVIVGSLSQVSAQDLVNAGLSNSTKVKRARLSFKSYRVVLAGKE